MRVTNQSGLIFARSARNLDFTGFLASNCIGYERFPELFPPKLGKALKTTDGAKMNRQNDAVEFIWDDGTTMEGLLEGNQTVDGIKYPKQLCSGPAKNVLGKYLRKRLGITDLDYQITKNDLLNYGRTDISISSQGEGVYELDFSV